MSIVDKILLEGTANPLLQKLIGKIIQGNMGLSFAEGIIVNVSSGTTNMINDKKAPLFKYYFSIDITKHHSWGNKKVGNTTIEILAANEKEALVKFKERIK